MSREEDIKLINPSNCCKSAPTENKKYDKKFNLATKICNNMTINNNMFCINSFLS